MNWANSYVQVSKEVFDEIQEMKRIEREIPHYKANLIELGDLAKQSKTEIISKMKHNLEEIEKQEKNERSKGWISSCGYTAFANKEKYVFPAFDYIFNLKKFSKMVNNLVSNRCNDYFDQMEKGDKYDKRNFPISYYIRFIEECRLQILEAIRKISDINKLHMVISFNKYNWTETISKTEKMCIPQSINFYIDVDGEIEILSCNSSSRSHKGFDNEITARSHWAIKKYSSTIYKLTEWETGFKKEFKINEYDLKD